MRDHSAYWVTARWSRWLDVGGRVALDRAMYFLSSVSFSPAAGQGAHDD